MTKVKKLKQDCLSLKRGLSVRKCAKIGQKLTFIINKQTRVLISIEQFSMLSQENLLKTTKTFEHCGLILSCF